ncbi:MAG: hypothetical protein JEZ06_21610 [Anaerolineaceae bacterium]|nr:hypothetical protein [Anaerolineaceae bacterium]
MSKKTQYKNFAVLTMQVEEVTVKTSKTGTAYATGRGRTSQGIAFKIMGFKEAVTSMETGRQNLIGRLSYEEWSDRNGNKHRNLVFLADKVERIMRHDRDKNFIQLTLRAFEDGEPRYSKKGSLWTKLRAFLSMGKDQAGKYKSSLFLNVKSFSKARKAEDGTPILDGAGAQLFDETVAASLAAVDKNALFTVKGQLIQEEWKGRIYHGIIAHQVEVLQPNEAGIGAPEMEDLGEPF